MKKTYRDIAAELSLHVKTIYRVLNNAPNVRPVTRRRVIAALSRNGFFDGARIGRERIVIEQPELEWSGRIAERLIRQLDQRIFELIPLPLESSRQEFLRAVEEASTVVLLSDPPAEWVARIRDANPDAVLINLFGNQGGDITLGEDHYATAAMRLWMNFCATIRTGRAAAVSSGTPVMMYRRRFSRCPRPFSPPAANSVTVSISC